MKKIMKILSVCLTVSAFVCPMRAFAASPQATLEPTASPQATEMAEATVSPQVTSEPTVSPQATKTAATAAPAKKYTSDTLDFHIVINSKKYVRDSFIKVEVYDTDNNLLGTDREWVGGITKSVDLHYDIPEYELGESFIVKLADGAVSLSYYDNTALAGETFTVTTNYYNDSAGNFVSGNTFNFNAVPNWEKEVVVYVNGSALTLKPRARIINDTALVPVRAVAGAMNLNVKYDGRYDSVTCSIGNEEIIYNLGTKYATFFGKDTYLTYPASYIQNTAYVPVRSLAEAFDAPIEAVDYGDRLDVIIGESQKVKDYMLQSPVNKQGITSRTSYLVWVSKSEYTVRVYTGSQYNWTLAYTAPCAIGAPGTPTITGSFEYIERTQWNYNGYYVGPVLRFYNGYALHSTLLYYGGGEYDGRVGVQISHGCVRLHPQDINWIADMIPIGTRIYITE